MSILVSSCYYLVQYRYSIEASSIEKKGGGLINIISMLFFKLYPNYSINQVRKDDSLNRSERIIEE